MDFYGSHLRKNTESYTSINGAVSLEWVTIVWVSVYSTSLFKFPVTSPIRIWWLQQPKITRKNRKRILSCPVIVDFSQ
ncbi:Uncharacterized protein APZ42_015485 [Daphnia magna]|uniref:Uncharacterized protein n=1 Tax=Daphnia magna TaxID=35525 RepID=A0A162PIY2_9CRUS|nr:Uncharacterized protein APZ42_015485 [Daphnia magna]